MKQLFACIFLLFILQTGNGQKLITCDRKHAYWAFEKNGSFLVVQLPGNAKSTNDVSVLSIGSFVLQAAIVPKKDYLKGLTDTTGLNPLISYAQNEGGYLSDQLNEKLELSISKAKVHDYDVLVWSFKMPEGIGEVREQVFADVVIGDRIFGLSSSQFINQTYEEVEDFLLNVIGTLKKVNSADELGRICGK